MTDPRAPVVVGVGQITQHLSSGWEHALEPLRLMEEATRRAGADTEADAILGRLDLVAVVGGIWRYKDPGRWLADTFEAPSARTILTQYGGNTPQALVTEMARRIAAGETDLVLCVGGEALHSRGKVRRGGGEVNWIQQDLPVAQRWGMELYMNTDHELARGFDAPMKVYAMLEPALAAAGELTMAEHLAAVGRMWEGYNAEAVGNPYAWSRTPLTAAEIVTPTAANRMINWPLTRAMNANMTVDQAAAVLMCSAATATALGVPRDRWVFPWSGADGSDTKEFSRRDRLDRSGAVRRTGQLALDLAGVTIGDIAHFDLYSCFPSMPQIACRELGIPTAGVPLTTTGGLAFFGGPVNNYSLHGIAAMAERLRAHPGELGLVLANGGYVTKESVGIYGTEPPATPFSVGATHHDPHRHASREVDEAPEGPATVEAYTVEHDAGVPVRALLSALRPDGRRALGASTHPDTMAWLMGDGGAPRVGEQVTMTPDGTVHVG